MRTVFALLVILSHSFPLGALGTDWLIRFGQGQEVLGGVAVKGFFVLSGFLITSSCLRSPSVFRYLWQRFLRVMPGFWAALLVVAFGFAPLIHWLQNGHSFRGFSVTVAGGSVDYVRKNFFLDMNQYDVAGLTSKLPAPNAFNGSLWTLIYEVKAYLIIGVLGVFGILKDRRVLVLGGVAVLYGLHVLNKAAPAQIVALSPRFADPQLIALILCFMLGSTWCLYQDRIQLDHRMGVLAIIVYFCSLRYSFYEISMPFAFTYAVMYLATYLPFRRFGTKADLSYGIYIYAFPVQQTLAQLKVNRHGLLVYAGASVLLTLPLAAASYFLVEKHFLKLKNLGLRKKLPLVAGDAPLPSEQDLSTETVVPSVP